jgi:predicted enzyme related to lactoylglutathione lyase
MLNLNSFLLFSADPKMLADFYSKIFGKQPEWTGGEFVGWKIGDGQFMIGPHDKVKGANANPERLIFNFETSEVEAEYKRMIEAGAKIVAAPYHPGEDKEMLLATLSDPDNNYFQLATPMK